MKDTFRQQHIIDEGLKEFADEIKTLAESLEERIEEIGRSRETSLALTKLEECVMWAVKSIYKSRDDKNIYKFEGDK